MNQLKYVFQNTVAALLRLLAVSKRYSLSKVFLSSIGKTDSAHVLVWMPFKWRPSYLGGDNFIKDVGLLSALENAGIEAVPVRSFETVDLSRKAVLFSASKYYNAFCFPDHSAGLRHVAEQLATSAGAVFPNPREAAFWENKVFMHNEFDRLGIITPKTVIGNIDDYSYETLTKLFSSHQFLIKEVHSFSAKGVHKVASERDYNEIAENCKINNKSESVLFQELVPMGRDLRVILVGDEIVLHYWRINKGSEWRPTSTGFGSEVDFDSFPEQWSDYIKDVFCKLGVLTGAFDICWRNDDTSTTPLVLEVSSFYQPNPRCSNAVIERHGYYGAWKKSLTFRDSYIDAHVDQIFRIQNHILRDLIETKRLSV